MSRTLRTLQIGVKSRHEWLGEDPLMSEDPAAYRFDYTAVAATKLVTYAIPFADLAKLPTKTRQQMASVAETRKKLATQRTLELYRSLKTIQKNLKYGELDEGADNKIAQETQALGIQIRELVQKDT